MPFAKGDANINRRGRPSASADIAAVFRDLAADFPDLAPAEARMLRVCAALLYRGERCRVAAVAHRCIAEARKGIAALRTQRAAAVAALPPPPKPTTQERVRAALAEMERQQP
jgi:hypothetical protein